MPLVPLRPLAVSSAKKLPVRPDRRRSNRPQWTTDDPMVASPLYTCIRKTRSITRIKKFFRDSERGSDAAIKAVARIFTLSRSGTGNGFMSVIPPSNHKSHLWVFPSCEKRLKSAQKHRELPGFFRAAEQPNSSFPAALAQSPP